MQIIEQIFLALLGFIFLRVAYKWMDKPDKLGQSFLFFLVAIGFFVCTLSGVQSLIKTNILWRFTKSLDDYGNKIDTFQTTITEMRDDLKTQQSILTSNQATLGTIQKEIQIAQIGVTNAQKGITTQFQNITYLQQQISAAQTNLYQQGQKLSDIELLVQNIFSRTVVETISGANTNKVFIVRNFGIAVQIGVILDHSPFSHSIHGWLQNRTHGLAPQLSLTPPDNVYRNYFTMSFQGEFDLTNSVLIIEYVRDDRETNLYHSPRVTTNHIYFDNGETFDLFK